MIKISELPAASALVGTETVAGVQSGVTVKILASAIGTFVRGLFTTTPVAVAEGGTGAATAAAARSTLGAVGTTGNETIAGDKTLSGNTVAAGTITMSGKSFIEAEGAAVASAASCNIWATDGNTAHVTGTTTITDFATAPQAGAWKKIIFDDALILTQGANLNVNGGGANVTTAAGDMAFVYADTTTQMGVFVVRKSGREVAPPTPILSAAYTSDNQTISSGGLLTLAHALGAAPKIVQFTAACLTAEHNYSIGDVVVLSSAGTAFIGAGSSAATTGFIAVVDATNVSIRFTNSSANPVTAFDKTTGAIATLTNANWAFVVRAYA